MFNTPKVCKVPLHEQLCKLWIRVLQEQVNYIHQLLCSNSSTKFLNVLQNATLMDLGKYVWFIFEVMTKSMTLYLHETDLLGSCQKRCSEIV